MMPLRNLLNSLAGLCDAVMIQIAAKQPLLSLCSAEGRPLEIPYLPKKVPQGTASDPGGSTALKSMQPLFGYDSMSRMMQDNHRRGMHPEHQGSPAQHRPVRFSIPVCCAGYRHCPGSPGRHLHVHHHCHHIQVEEGGACCSHTCTSQC